MGEVDEEKNKHAENYHPAAQIDQEEKEKLSLFDLFLEHDCGWPFAGVCPFHSADRD
jgi:hypothetical protein